MSGGAGGALSSLHQPSPYILSTVAGLARGYPGLERCKELVETCSQCADMWQKLPSLLGEDDIKEVLQAARGDDDHDDDLHDTRYDEATGGFPGEIDRLSSRASHSPAESDVEVSSDGRLFLIWLNVVVFLDGFIERNRGTIISFLIELVNTSNTFLIHDVNMIDPTRP